jgi:hypothetical protein
MQGQGCLRDLPGQRGILHNPPQDEHHRDADHQGSADVDGPAYRTHRGQKDDSRTKEDEGREAHHPMRPEDRLGTALLRPE